MLLGLTLFSLRIVFLQCYRLLTWSAAGGTLFCGLANSMNMLILARAIAGMVGVSYLL